MLEAQIASVVVWEVKQSLAPGKDGAASHPSVAGNLLLPKTSAYVN